MRAIAIIAGALVALNLASAQVPTTGPRVVGSGSGQFFVSSRGYISPRSLEMGSQRDMTSLDPALLAVSCERIKAQLLRQINMPDQWRGKIFIAIHPARSAYEPIAVAAQRFGGKWQCVMELPDAVDRNRLVEAVVRASLLEIANRNATERSVEMPEWLVRGLARELMGTAEVKLILPPPTKVENGWTISRTTVDFSDTPLPSATFTRKMNSLTDAAEILKTHEPLTFDEMSWPTDEQLSGSRVDIYNSSAQLFVNKLLHEKNGPQYLRAMLAEMPDYLNWQFAFLNAFEPMFKTQLDVEKWWALEIRQFGERDLLHLLTPQESMKQLDAIFDIPIDVQIGQTKPMRTGITLQTVIRGWSRPRQLETLKNTAFALEALHLRVAPEFVVLVDQYRLVLQDYYRKRSVSTRILMDLRLVSDKSAEEAIQRLDVLDVQRSNMRRQISAPVTASAAAALQGILSR